MPRYKCDNFTESVHSQAEQTTLRNELESLKAAQSTSGGDENTPQRPRKKEVPRALTVTFIS